MAPVRPDGQVNIQVQSKYDITEMRHALVSQGWNDRDIIFLTTTDEHTRTTPSTSTTTEASNWNGYWIDGEAFHDNLDDDVEDVAFNALINGGYYKLQQDDGSWVYQEPYCKSSDTDIVMFYFISNAQATESDFHTYNYGNYNPNSADYFTVTEFSTKLASISSHYVNIVLNFQKSGTWISSINGNNHIIVTSSQPTETHYKYCLLFYDRINGNERATYYTGSGSNWGLVQEGANGEPANADGCIGFPEFNGPH